MVRKIQLAGVAALGLSACFYPADRGRQLETRVDRLTDDEKQQAEGMQTQLAELSKKSDAKISEMNQALDALDKSEHRSGADMGIQLQKLAEDVASLRGQVDGYLFKIGQLEATLTKMQTDIDQKLLALKGEEAVKAAEAKKKADEMKRPTDKKEFLALADDKAKGGDAALARELYNEFLKKWPKDDLVGDAHYGLGETYFTEDKCREALAEYQKVIQNFPKAKTTPAAYLHTADCFGKLKMVKESKLALEELVKSYPKSDSAKKAKERLDQDKKKGTK